MKKIFSLLVFFFCVPALFAQNGQNNSIDQIIKTPPNPPRLVNDYANVLTPEQRDALERKLYQFDDTTSNQVVVVIVSSLDGKDVADAAIELGRNWKVGDKKNNNGVVLLISKDDRKLNISPGYGLERSLPDLVCQQIIQTIIVPNFKGNDYYRGLDQGTDAIIRAVKGTFKTPRQKSKGSGGGGLGKWIIILFIIIFLISRRGGGGKGTYMSRRGGTGIADAILWSTLLGGGRGGGGGWSGGGGGSSGGFGGFGGGSFGGGGASGSW